MRSSTSDSALIISTGIGHPASRSDRTAKYNQLIRIEEQLGASAVFAGRAVLRR